MMNALNISNWWHSESCTPEGTISRKHYVWIMKIWNFPIWQICFHRWCPWQLHHWSTLGGATQECFNKLNNQPQENSKAPESDAACVNSKTLWDSEGVISVNDNCSAVIGPAVNQDTETALAHSSKNAHQRSTGTTSILEMNILMENKRSSKGKGPKMSLSKEKKYDCESEQRET